MPATAILFEYHDTLEAPAIDCRVNLTVGPRTYTLQVDVPRDGLPAAHSPEDLAEVCATELGIDVGIAGGPL